MEKQQRLLLRLPHLPPTPHPHPPSLLTSDLIHPLATHHRFGEGLEVEEQQWLVYEINRHLEEMRGSAIDFESMPPPEAPKIYRDNEEENR